MAQETTVPCTRPTTQCVQQLIVLVKNLPWALVPSHACLARHVQSVPPSLSCQRLRTLGPKTNTSRPNDNCRGRNKKKKKKNAIHKKAQTVRMQKKESGEISLHHRHPQRGFCEKKRPPPPSPLCRGSNTRSLSASQLARRIWSRCTPRSELCWRQRGSRQLWFQHSTSGAVRAWKMQNTVV